MSGEEVTLRILGRPLAFALGARAGVAQVEACKRNGQVSRGPCPKDPSAALKPILKRAAGAPKVKRARAVPKASPQPPAAAPSPSRPVTSVRAADLISADGGQLSAEALRAIADIVGPAAGEFTTEIGQVSSRKNNTVIPVTLRDRDGKIAGEFEAVLKSSGGKITAEHAPPDPSSGVAAQGAFAALENRLMDWYESAGVSSVETIPESMPDSYSRAMGGYDWGGNGRIPKPIIDALAYTLRHGGSQADVDQVEDILTRAQLTPGHPDYPTPFELYNLDRPDGATARDEWESQELFEGLTWKAKRHLPRDPNAPRTTARARRLKEIAAMHDRYVTLNETRTRYAKDATDPATMGAFYIDYDAPEAAQRNYYEQAREILSPTRPAQDPLFSRRRDVGRVLAHGEDVTLRILGRPLTFALGVR